MLVHNFLENSVIKYPDKTAVIHGNLSFTYSDIDFKSNQIANSLRENGVEKGDRVAILMENSINYIISYYGISKADCIVVPLYHSASSKDIISIFNNCQVSCLISNANHKDIINISMVDLTSLKLIIYDGDSSHLLEWNNIRILEFSEIWHSYSNSHFDTRCIDIDTASIIYTSGSTGKPKGVMLSHLNILSNTNSIIEYLHITKDDRIMAILPFPYVYGKSLLNTHFKVGGSIVINNQFLYPNIVLRDMIDKDVTGFSGVPSTFAILLHRSSIKKMTFKSLKYVTQAGGAMAPILIKKLIEVLPNTKIYIMYGATEAAARLSYLEPEKLAKKNGSIGKAIPNVELKIIKDNSTEAETGEEGEIVAKGSNIMNGYWNDPEETQKVISEHGYHTGDLAITDEEGFIYVVGRKNEMIKMAGHRISPKEIEDVLLEYENVHEAAVISIADPVLGEAIKAFIVSQNGIPLSEDDILKYCVTRLPHYKIPKYMEIRNTLPKNASGKILKQK